MDLLLLSLVLVATVLLLVTQWLLRGQHLSEIGLNRHYGIKVIAVQRSTRSLDVSVLLILAAALPLGLAMQKTGLAEHVARGAVGFAGDFGPVALVGAVYLVTSVLTGFLSNAATAVLLAPVVLQIAAETGFNPKPLLVAVAFGASASFFTPIGYQTNLVVMGPGGYLFRDYLRIGIALNLILWLAATFLIPVFWPL
jgi:di/tricarboxylate transporter